jgi:hypothetical protein
MRPVGIQRFGVALAVRPHGFNFTEASSGCEQGRASNKNDLCKNFASPFPDQKVKNRGSIEIHRQAQRSNGGSGQQSR